MSRKPLLEVRDLCLSFAPTHDRVLHGISFSLEEGEILGICGESGSGKSVSALSLMNLLPETARKEGEIYFRGEALHGLSEKEWQGIRGDEIGMVFQNAQTALNPTKRIGKQVEECLIIQAREMSKEDRQKKVLELLSLLDLPRVETLVRAYPHELSGGMKQRVGLAMAIINEPEILIADEPTTALDPFLQDKLLALLLDLRKTRKMSLILISHDIRLVEKYCDRVLIFYAGKIVEEGPAELVFTEPGHWYTKCLLEAMPKQKKRGQELFEIPGRVPSAAERSEILARENPPCLFANRCPFARELCFEKSPAKVDLGQKHFAACHLARPPRETKKVDEPVETKERNRGGIQDE